MISQKAGDSLNLGIPERITNFGFFQESQIRGLAITRKNCLFASSEEGALAWSKLLTILQTAILNKCDPTLYLKYLLDKVTVLMDSDIKYKDVDWSQFRPWNIDQQTLQNAWDT